MIATLDKKKLKFEQTKLIRFDNMITNINTINYVLSYVKPTERRVLEFEISNAEINAKLICKKADYGIKPFEYLSSSELMISTAQVGHLLIDNFIQQSFFQYSSELTPEILKQLRDNHEIYFVDMSFKFHKKVEIADYEMKMKIENFKRIRNNYIAKFTFNVGNSIKGAFVALV